MCGNPCWMDLFDGDYNQTHNLCQVPHAKTKKTLLSFNLNIFEFFYFAPFFFIVVMTAASFPKSLLWAFEVFFSFDVCFFTHILCLVKSVCITTRKHQIKLECNENSHFWIVFFNTDCNTKWFIKALFWCQEFVGGRCICISGTFCICYTFLVYLLCP